MSGTKVADLAYAHDHQGTPQLPPPPKLLHPCLSSDGPGAPIPPLSTKSNRTEAVSNQSPFNKWEGALFQEMGELIKTVTPPPPLHLRRGQYTEEASSTHRASCCPPCHATDTVHGPQLTGPSRQQPCSHLEGQAIPSGGLLVRSTQEGTHQKQS